VKKLRTIFIGILLLATAVASQAATYGYVTLNGLDPKEKDLVINKLNKYVQNELEGKILRTVLLSTGRFIKRTNAIVIFKGENEPVVKFLTQGIYTGDIIGQVSVRCVFKHKNSNFVEIKTIFFPEIERALSAFIGKKASDFDSRATEACAIFYSGKDKCTESNKIFQYLDGKSFIDCSSLIDKFDKNAYPNTITIKNDSLTLMDKAINSYSKSESSVNALKIRVEKAYEYVKGRPQNNNVTKQWEIMKDPSRNLLGGFFARWKKQKILSKPFIEEAKKNISIGFDQIIDIEGSKIK
jgi:hypothetical protein